MDKYKRTNLKKHITLALLLSMAVVTPRAYALPGQGQYQSANEVKAVINSTSNSMNITGNQTNTALNWESFNVAKAESVNFKGADKNYLNLIHDANASKIMGALNGDGGKIYLINPNGVLFGAEAKVNMGAGSLVASTRPLDQVGTAAFEGGGSPLTALGDSSQVTGNITNLGTLQATSVVFEGNDVTLTNRANIKNADNSAVLNTPSVVVKAAGNVNVGYNPGTTTRKFIINGSIQGKNVYNYVNGNAAPALNYTVTDLAGTTKAHKDAMIVSDVYDLQNITSNLAGNYVLTNDIEAETTSKWTAGNTDSNGITVVKGGFTPIGVAFTYTHGSEVTAFNGTLDGAYCTITNLYQRIPKFNIGLFGEIGETGSISKLNVTGSISGSQYVGAIAGSNKGTISEVSNAAAVTGIDTFSFGDMVGGVVGTNTGTVSNAQNNGTITGQTSAGGIIGESLGGKLANLVNTGAVTAEAGIAGGLVGNMKGGTLTIDTAKGLKKTTNSGTVTGSSVVGGIAGAVQNGSVLGTGEFHQITNTGAVTGTNAVGGVIGFVGADETGTYNYKYLTNTGTVLNNSTDSNSGYTGGVFGEISPDKAEGTINLSFIINDANVTSSVGSTGGVIGAWHGTGKGTMLYVSNNNSENNKVVSGTECVGGILGTLEDKDVTLLSGYNLAEVMGTGKNVGGVIGDLECGTLKPSNDAITNSGNVTGDTSVGGIAGFIGYGSWDMVNNVSIRTIIASGSNYGVTNSGNVKGVSKVGGIAGSSQGLITGNANRPILNTGTVTSTDIAALTIDDTGGPITGSMAGGIVGENFDQISYVTNEGAVSGTAIVGGLVGFNSKSSIEQGINKGTVTSAGSNGEATGGLAGYSSGIITTSYNIGEVNGVKSVGGIVGINAPILNTVYDSKNGGWAWDANHFWYEVTAGTSVSTVYNVGKVTGTGENAGGIAGLSKGSEYTNVYNTGKVTGGTNVGGLLGKVTSEFISPIYTNNYPAVDTGETKTSNVTNTITNAYNTGAVTGSAMGGLVGSAVAGTIVTGSYYATTNAAGDAINAANDSGLGTAKTLAQMKRASLYTGWDLDSTGGNNNVWRIYQGETMPLLKYWLTPVTVTGLTNQYVEYDGNVHAPTFTGETYSSSVDEYKIFKAGAVSATGKYALLYSNQDGYDISGDKIFKLARTLTLNTSAPMDYTYGATEAPKISKSFTGFVNGDTETTASQTGSVSFDTSGAFNNGKTANAGDYTYTYNGDLDFDDYNFTTNTTNHGTGIITVQSAELSFVDLNTSAPADYTYGATTAPVIGWGFTGFAAGETYDTVTKTGNVSFDTSAAFNNGKTADAGNYTYTYNGDLSFKNYHFTTDTTGHGTGTITVNKAVLNLNTSAPADYTYGATEAPKISKNFTGFAYGETETTASQTGSAVFDTSAAFNNGKTANAGQYAYTYNGDLNFKNYNFTADTTDHGKGTITVHPAELNIFELNTSAPTDYTYGATEAPVIGWEFTGFAAGDSYDSAVKTGSVSFDTSDAFSGGKTADAGDYRYSYNGNLSFTNYRFTSNTDGHGTGTITVHKAPLTLTANSVNMTYGQAENQLVYGYAIDAVNKLVNGDTAAVLSGIGYDNTAYNANGTTKNVDTIYTVAPKVTLKNYDVTAKTGVVNMNKAPLTITANHVTMTYGQKASEVINDYSIDTVNKLVNGDTSDVLSGIKYINTAYNADGTTKDIGSTYSVTPNVMLTNYDVTANAGTVTMNKAILNLAANDVDMTYGQKASEVDYGSTHSGLVNGDTAELLDGIKYINTAYNDDGTTKDVGQTYTILPNVVLKNYDVVARTGNVNLNKAALTITPKKVGHVVYGDRAGITGKYDYTISGLVNGDTSAKGISGMTTYITEAVQGSRTSNVGTYDLTVDAGNLTSANYNFIGSTMSNAITITPVTVTISANNISGDVKYGDTNIAGKFNYSVSGLVNGDNSSVIKGSPNYTTTAWNGIKTGNAGIYNDIAASDKGSLNSTNYVFNIDSATKGTVTIIPINLTLTADQITMREGDALPVSFTGKVSGYVNGDTATESPIFIWNGTGTPTIGTYGILGYLGGKSSGKYGSNYNILQDSGNSKALTITSRLSGADYGRAITSLIPRHGNQIITPLYGIWVSQPAENVNVTTDAMDKVGKVKAELVTKYYVDLDKKKHFLE